MMRWSDRNPSLDHLHNDLGVLGPDSLIEVTLDHPANVLLLDPTNYGHYQNHRAYRYRGGYITASPYRLHPPHEGHWHLVVDLGGGPGEVRASARIIPPTLAAAQ